MPEERNCILCGKTFKPRNDEQTFCKKECCVQYYKIQRIYGEEQEDGSDNEPPLFAMRVYARSGGFSRKAREDAIKRDNYRCYICGRDTNLHVHHIIPRSQGGDDDLQNLITLCSGCHRSIESGNPDLAIVRCTERINKLR